MAVRNYCFTINNPTQTPQELYDAFEPLCKYLVVQKEQGLSGTVHYQGYIELNKTMRHAGLSKIVRAHYAARAGTREQARDYCMKEDTRIEGPWEFGEFGKTRGARSDLDSVARLVQEGKTNKEIYEISPGTTLRYLTHINKLRSIFRPNGTGVEVHLLYGPPGTGKTRFCYDTHPELWAVPLGKNLWFDNYQNEENVLLDDFSGQLSLTDCLRLLDRYVIQVPIKGGFVWWNPMKIMITTNVHPRDWYDYSSRSDSYLALQRRIHFVWEFKKDVDFDALNCTPHDDFF